MLVVYFSSLSGFDSIVSSCCVDVSSVCSIYMAFSRVNALPLLINFSLTVELVTPTKHNSDLDVLSPSSYAQSFTSSFKSATKLPTDFPSDCILA